MIGDLTLIALYNLPMFGEVYLVYQGEATASVVQPGPESSEVQFFLPSEIPWDSLAFPMVVAALTLWAQALDNPGAKVHSLDFLWGPEGAVRVRRYPR